LLSENKLNKFKIPLGLNQYKVNSKAKVDACDFVSSSRINGAGVFVPLVFKK